MIPWGISRIIKNTDYRTAKVKLTLLSMVWLFFLPNAPYIVMDLFHLRYSTEMPVWYDLLLVFSYAWAGLVFGFRSLFLMEEKVLSHLPKVLYRLSVPVILFLCSFGVYLGRYLRWNSWDIINRPAPLMLDILDRVFYPFNYPGTWGMTFLMGLVLNLKYYTIRWNAKHT